MSGDRIFADEAVTYDAKIQIEDKAQQVFTKATCSLCELHTYALMDASMTAIYE